MSTKATFNEIETLERIERELDEALEHEYLCDLAYTRYYRTLEKRRRIIHKTIQRLRRLQQCQ